MHNAQIAVLAVDKNEVFRLASRRGVRTFDTLRRLDVLHLPFQVIRAIHSSFTLTP